MKKNNPIALYISISTRLTAMFVLILFISCTNYSPDERKRHVEPTFEVYGYIANRSRKLEPIQKKDFEIKGGNIVLNSSAVKKFSSVYAINKDGLYSCSWLDVRDDDLNPVIKLNKPIKLPITYHIIGTDQNQFDLGKIKKEIETLLSICRCSGIPLKVDTTIEFNCSHFNDSIKDFKALKHRGYVNSVVNTLNNGSFDVLIVDSVNNSNCRGTVLQLFSDCTIIARNRGESLLAHEIGHAFGFPHPHETKVEGCYIMPCSGDVMSRKPPRSMFSLGAVIRAARVSESLLQRYNDRNGSRWDAPENYGCDVLQYPVLDCHFRPFQTTGNIDLLPLKSILISDCSSIEEDIFQKYKSYVYGDPALRTFLQGIRRRDSTSLAQLDVPNFNNSLCQIDDYIIDLLLQN